MKRKWKVSDRFTEKSFIIGLLILGIFITCRGRSELMETNFKKPKRVLLLGASIGKGWNFPKWPERMKKDGYVFEFVAFYSFDKSKAIDEILIRPKRKFYFTKSFIRNIFKQSPKKPNVIIIKECAAYFPGNLEEYKILVKRWIAQCIEANIKPILATTIPITKELSLKKRERLNSIIEFNDWIKKYARNKNIYCLDLEAALRVSEKDRSLRPDLANKDILLLDKIKYFLE